MKHNKQCRCILAFGLLIVNANLSHGQGIHPDRISVDGSKYAATQTGIQQAINDACSANRSPVLYLPAATITLDKTSGQQFLVPCALGIEGSGDNSTIFAIVPNIPSTVPVFRVQPSKLESQSWGWFKHFKITSGKGSGGDGITFDGNGNSEVTGPAEWTVEDLLITGLTKGAHSISTIGCKNSNCNQGWFYVVNNRLNNGTYWGSQTVDAVMLFHNDFNAQTGTGTACAEVSLLSGAAKFTMLDNHGGCEGGWLIAHNGAQYIVEGNQIEAQVPTTEANSAVIDLQGNNGNIDGSIIWGNNINAHSNANINIRLGATTNTFVEHNVMSLRPSQGIGILVTNDSKRVQEANNEFIGAEKGARAISGSVYSLSGNRVVLNGVNPPACSITGAGAGSECTLAPGSTDSGGEITIKTGATPGASGLITLTFSSPFGSNGTACVATLNNGTSEWNPRASIIGSGGRTAFEKFAWDNNGVALTPNAAGAHSISYWCSGR